MEIARGRTYLWVPAILAALSAWVLASNVDIREMNVRAQGLSVQFLLSIILSVTGSWVTTNCLDRLGIRSTHRIVVVLSLFLIFAVAEAVLIRFGADDVFKYVSTRQSLGLYLALILLTPAAFLLRTRPESVNSVHIEPRWATLAFQAVVVLLVLVALAAALALLRRHTVDTMTFQLARVSQSAIVYVMPIMMLVSYGVALASSYFVHRRNL